MRGEKSSAHQASRIKLPTYQITSPHVFCGGDGLACRGGTRAGRRVAGMKLMKKTIAILFLRRSEAARQSDVAGARAHTKREGARLLGL